MAGYVAPNQLQDVHDWRRFDIRDASKAVSNDFNPDWNTPGGVTYLSSLLSISGVYWAFGAIAFLLFLTLNSVYVCCCAKKRANEPQKKPGVLAYVFSPCLWWVVCVVVMLAGTGTAISQVDLFKNSVVRSVGALTRVQDLLQTTSNSVAWELTPQLTNATTTAGDFCSEANARSSPYASAVCSIQPGLSSASSASASVSTQLNATASALNSQLKKGGSADLNHLGYVVHASGVAVLAVFLAWVLSTVFTLLPNKCCATTFRVCNGCMIFVLGLVFLFTGTFSLLAMLGSDVCVAPSQAIQRVANLTQSGADATATLVFYTSCDPNITYTSAGGAYGQILDGQQRVITATSAVSSLAGAMAAEGWAQQYLQSLTMQLGATNATLSSVATSVSCGPVNSIYGEILAALCSNGIVGVVNVWALATAACFLIFVMAIAGSRLCWRHPGDESKPAEDSQYIMSTMPTTVSGAPSAYGGMGASGAPAAYGSASAYGGGATAPREWR